ncbi:carboxypeptidase regulatory-like domain-containing protein [Myxococcota bacterium]|nr:carboxypeptidase regulatory-like domain-containing protein [Myxococcota bacterium]
MKHLFSLMVALLVSTMIACGNSNEPEASSAGASDGAPTTVPVSPPEGTAALTGDVVDYHGRPLGGAMITARDEQKSLSVSVFSDGNGHYEFPPMVEGSWKLGVRIPGFEQRTRQIQLGAGGLDADFQLRLEESPNEHLPASYYFSRIEWPSPEMRANFTLACANCHQIGDALWRKSRTAAEWEAVVARMEFRGPPLLAEARERLIPTLMAVFDSEEPLEFDLPEPPSGDATRAVIWEYDVDPEGRNGCHDLEMGLDGTLYTEDGFAVNPQTLERWHWPVPRGAHSIERDPSGDMWITVTGTDLLTKLDVESGETINYEHPKIGDDKGVYPHTLRFDEHGRIWYTLTVSNHVAVFDPKNESFTYYDLPGAMSWTGPVPIPIAYGLDIAPNQTVWWSQLLADTIGVLDPESGEVRSWPTPFHSPRRLRVGPDNVVWVPGYGSSVLGRFDPVTETWKVYDLPTKPKGSELPYALAVNHQTGDVWVAGSNSDTLIRFDPDTEKFTSYPLPTPVDFIREIEFDEDNNVWTCVPDRGTGPDGPLSGRFIKLTLLPREGTCGDGRVQLGEQCDDSNLRSGDGCASDCNWETLETAEIVWED